MLCGFWGGGMRLSIINALFGITLRRYVQAQKNTNGPIAGLLLTPTILSPAHLKKTV